MNEITRTRNLIWSWWYHTKSNVAEWIAKHAPKIPTRRPDPPDRDCICFGCSTDDDEKRFTVLSAFFAGDGWVFSWDCEAECGDGIPIEGWYPFHFGAWCTGEDLEKIGINVI